MKTIIIMLIALVTITGCDDGRYEGMRLWSPGSPDHEDICGIRDWKEDKVLPVEDIPEGDWDRSDWSWVPREGCPQ